MKNYTILLTSETECKKVLGEEEKIGTYVINGSELATFEMKN